jgi:diadenosine tetraphosphate (Ap4A) HIT family hydrolase
MEGCVFCGIAAGRIPAQKIWEDESFVAFLDINPLRVGQSLVVPKQHWESYVFNLTEEQMTQLFLAARKVARKLDKTLGSLRTAQVMEGLGVSHAHVKLYPIKLSEGEGGLVSVGLRATNEELEKTAKLINQEGGED